MEAVAIPVFQFIMFSEPDLSIFPGANFNIGGRVHTNGNLWLAAGNGATLQTTGKWTAIKDIIRPFLRTAPRLPATNSTGTVSMATSQAAPLGNRNLLVTEGSVVGMPGSAPYANWQTVSLGAGPANYNGFLFKSGRHQSARHGREEAEPAADRAVRWHERGHHPASAGRRGPPLDSVQPAARQQGQHPHSALRQLRGHHQHAGYRAGAPIQLDGNWRVAGRRSAPVCAGYTGGPIARSIGTR